ncbi:MASE1 domain-containing protein [Polyangium sp. y55x31]|uniref:MASE1 domain-containing protein n=1 Tax=Polyangium sp. y55x31 TaxID=3042688 RepID=UPI002482D1F3|nr:MASE1 domain-containing protein [Polyangium sp. y55x31]MDI1480160.1 MASE1 domain-containing protein [Polyangium sp. y55x31]
MQRPRAGSQSRPIAVLLLAVVYAAGAAVGQLLAIPPGNVTACFPASGIALAGILLGGRRLWPGVWLGSFLVNTYAFFDTTSLAGAAVTTLVGAMIGVGATIEALVAARVFPPWDRDAEAPLARVLDVARFTALSGLGSSTTSATIGTTSLLAGSLITPAHYAETWVTWWLGDAVGILVITPLLLACSQPRWWRVHGRGGELALHQLALFGFQVLLISGMLPAHGPNYPLGHFITPFLVWAGVRLGPLGAALAVFNVSALVTWGAAQGTTPFLHGTRNVSLLLVQAYVGDMALTTLVLAAVIAERTRAEMALAHSRDELDLRVAERTAALSESEERYRILVEVSPDATLLERFDADGVLRIEYANAAAARLFGVTRAAELLGKPVFDFVLSEREGIAHRGVLRALEHGNLGPVDGWVARADGTTVEVEIMLARVPRGGKCALLAIYRDITRRKQIEEERAALYREAEESIRARDEFLAIASHELKTPLTALSLKLQALCRSLQTDPDLAAKIAPALDVALRQTRRLNTLVDELLDVSRITQGRLELRLDEDVDLSAVAEDVVQRMQDTAARAGCELRLDSDAAVVGRWDRSRVEQVLMNLLSNAIKYGARAPIDVRVRDEGASARVSVTDRGIGIPAEDQKRIFDRFERAVSVRHFGGFGLGLWIARRIVEALGGTIAVESAPGEGATFTVTLPRARTPAGA